MHSKHELKTNRLILRHWKESDTLPFAKLCADKEVMKHFPATLTKEEAKNFLNKIQDELKTKPYGLWAVELKSTGTFIGFVGLHYQNFKASFTPCVEIGWRIAKEFWGNGYATEAAKKVLEYAFSIGIETVYSFTILQNERSIALMKRIGMIYSGEFARNELPELYQKHVLYKISAPCPLN